MPPKSYYFLPLKIQWAHQWIIYPARIVFTGLWRQQELLFTEVLSEVGGDGLSWGLIQQCSVKRGWTSQAKRTISELVFPSNTDATSFKPKMPPKSYYFLPLKSQWVHQWIIYPAFCPSEEHSVAKLIILWAGRLWKMKACSRERGKEGALGRLKGSSWNI